MPGHWGLALPDATRVRRRAPDPPQIDPQQLIDMLGPVGPQLADVTRAPGAESIMPFENLRPPRAITARSRAPLGRIIEERVPGGEEFMMGLDKLKRQIRGHPAGKVAMDVAGIAGAEPGAFVTGAGVWGAALPKGGRALSFAEAAVKAHKSGGSTFNPRTGAAVPLKGKFFYSPDKANEFILPEGQVITPEIYTKYVAEREAAGALKDPESLIGSYVSDAGRDVLDVSRGVESRAQAMKGAAKAGEEAIFDGSAFANISVPPEMIAAAKAERAVIEAKATTRPATDPKVAKDVAALKEEAMDAEVARQAAMKDVETVGQAAAQTKDGRIFTGVIHTDAIEQAIKAGIEPIEAYSLKLGFVTSKRPFVSGDEALEIVRRGEQISEKLLPQSMESGKLFSEEVPEARRILRAREETMDAEIARRVAREEVARQAAAKVETVNKAAVRTPDGRIFTGVDHTEAAQRAEDAGAGIVHAHMMGFQTSKGRFVSRDEARTVFEKADAARDAAKTSGQKGGLISGDLPPTGDPEYHVASRLFREGNPLTREKFDAIARDLGEEASDQLFKKSRTVWEQLLKGATNNEMPTVRSLTEQLQEGYAGFEFYDDALREAQAVLGKKDGRMFLRFFAATSPSAEFKLAAEPGTNMDWARHAFIEWKEGVPFGSKYPYNYHKTTVGNLERAARGEPLSGMKVDPFDRALRGDLEAIVVDRWIMRAFKFERRKPDGSLAGPNKTQQRFIEQIIREDAARWGLDPRQYQAALWQGALKKAGQFEEIPPELVGKLKGIFPGTVLKYQVEQAGGLAKWAVEKGMADPRVLAALAAAGGGAAAAPLLGTNREPSPPDRTKVPNRVPTQPRINLDFMR